LQVCLATAPLMARLEIKRARARRFMFVSKDGGKLA
jgi:hypothetical protein